MYKYLKQSVIGRYVSKVRQGLVNIWLWRKVIWSDRDWDWVFLITILHFKLEKMVKYHRVYGVNVDSEKTATQIHRTALACKRLMTKDYDEYDPVFLKVGKWVKKIDGVDFQTYMQQQDVKYVSKMLTKHLLYWWD